MEPYIGKTLSKALEQEDKNINIIEVRTGSDSDFSRIQEGILEKLDLLEIPYLLTIKSAHRTPKQMIESAQAFPNVKLPSNIQTTLDITKLKIIASIAVAGGSAHIAGMTAAETTIPVIAQPVESSAMGIIDALLSMINMPPGIPNGVCINQETTTKMVKNLYNLQLQETYNKISIKNEALIDKKLLKEIGIEIAPPGKSPIEIYIQNLDSEDKMNISDTQIPIIIPIMKDRIDLMNKNRKEKEILNDIKKIQKLQLPGFYMGLNIHTKIKTTNALLYAAKILGTHNPSIQRKLQKYNGILTKKNINKDRKILKKQLNNI